MILYYLVGLATLLLLWLMIIPTFCGLAWIVILGMKLFYPSVREFLK